MPVDARLRLALSQAAYLPQSAARMLSPAPSCPPFPRAALEAHPQCPEGSSSAAPPHHLSQSAYATRLEVCWAALLQREGPRYTLSWRRGGRAKPPSARDGPRVGCTGEMCWTRNESESGRSPSVEGVAGGAVNAEPDGSPGGMLDGPAALSRKGPAAHVDSCPPSPLAPSLMQSPLTSTLRMCASPKVT